MRTPSALIPRSTTGLLFTGAGACLLTAQALLPAYPSPVRRQVAVAAGHRAAEATSVVTFVAAGVLLVFAVAASSSLIVARGRALARVGLILTGIGALWPAVGRATFTAILVALTGHTDRSAAVTAVHAISDSRAFALFLPLLVAFALGPVLLTLGLRRAGALAVWPAILWFVGVLVVNAAEDQSRVLATAGMVAVATALAWIGHAIGTSTSAPDNRPTTPSTAAVGTS